MKYDPVSEESAGASSSSVFPPGDYDYEVRDASEQTSQAGNEMIKLELWVYDTQGGRRLVFDYLVSSAAWKIRQFAASCGMLPQYERGELAAEELSGRTGRLTLKVEDNPQYGAQNKVRQYVKGKDAPVSAPRPSSRAKAPAGDDLNDEIPF